MCLRGDGGAGADGAGTVLGRVPVFVEDDVTDEAGLAAAQELGGRVAVAGGVWDAGGIAGVVGGRGGVTFSVRHPDDPTNGKHAWRQYKLSNEPIYRNGYMT